MSLYAAVILAAGQAARFRAAGGSESTKLVAPLDGEPLIRHVARTALRSRARPVVVVTGHARTAVEAVLHDLPLTFAHNPYYAEGLSSSLRAGIAAVPATCAGAVVLLADMPRVDVKTIDALIDRAGASPAADAVVPLHKGQKGNPVLLSRTVFSRVEHLTGDRGARKLLSDPALWIEEIESSSPGILDDVDDPDDLARLRNADGPHARR